MKSALIELHYKILCELKVACNQSLGTGTLYSQACMQHACRQDYTDYMKCAKQVLQEELNLRLK